MICMYFSMLEFKYNFNYIHWSYIKQIKIGLSKYIKLSSISTCPRLLTLELEDFSLLPPKLQRRGLVFLLPPKLQRRGLVFERKLVTMERV